MADQDNTQNDKIVDKTGRMQSVDFKEYAEMKAQKEQKQGRKMPMPLKIVLLTPLVIIFCIGVFFIPYMIFLIATSPAAEEAKPTAYETVMKKK